MINSTKGASKTTKTKTNKMIISTSRGSHSSVLSYTKHRPMSKNEKKPQNREKRYRQPLLSHLVSSTFIHSTNILILSSPSPSESIQLARSCCCTICCTLFTRAQDLATSPTNGTTGKLSQSHISIIKPSGSWKNNCSTKIPPSSTSARTYLIPISFKNFSTFPTLSH